jgi:uncharacterized membrane protein YeaQ/YmgE (transglycosylase-associated protein family)
VLTAIIGAIIGGLIIGALARLALPGKQNISMAVTIIIGILGSLITTLILSTVFDYKNASGGAPWLAWLISIAVAAGLIVAYGNFAGGRQIRR